MFIRSRIINKGLENGYQCNELNLFDGPQMLNY